MKNLFATAIMLASLSLQAQYTYFVKNNASLSRAFTVSDSVYIAQSDIYQITTLSGGGSQILYLRGGAQKSVDVKEEIGDSSIVASTFSFTISTNDTLDGITVAGVTIAPEVPVAGSITATAAAIADSINATTSSPNYRSTSAIGVVNIYLVTDSTTGNSRTVVVDYQGTATPTTGVLASGFNSRNILTIYGADNKLIETTIKSKESCLNASYCSEMSGDNPTTMWYSKGGTRNFTINETRVALQAKVNAVLD